MLDTLSLTQESGEGPVFQFRRSQFSTRHWPCLHYYLDLFIDTTSQEQSRPRG